MNSPIELSISQHFEIERFSRAIDNTSDVVTLRAIAKQLLQAWQIQRAAASWVIRHHLTPPTEADGRGDPAHHDPRRPD